MSKWRLDGVLGNTINKLFVSSQVGPVSKYEDIYSKIKKYIDSHSERPLFIPVVVLIAKWTSIDDLIKAEEALDRDYPGQIKCVRMDELLLAIKEYGKGDMSG